MPTLHRQIIDNDDDGPGTSFAGPRAASPLQRNPESGGGGKEMSPKEGEIETYLNGIQDVNNLKINVTKKRITLNFPLYTGGVVNRDVLGRMLQELSNALRGREARINVEAGLLLRSKINAKLSHYYASNNTNVFRRLLIFNVDNVRNILQQLLSIDYSRIGHNIRPDTDWEFVQVTNIRIIAYL